jgi:hypothetical protein
MFAPYDESTYQAVLELLHPEDRVLDIGAGDLQFSRRMAQIARIVFAVEINNLVLQQGLASQAPVPDNLIIVHADARALEVPSGITVGVLLMRHCTHFDVYLEKFRMAGARRLLTNARWHMAVEEVDLQAERISFRGAGMGWYACRCGATGFKVGPAEQWSNEMDKVMHEVTDCPHCNQI